MKYLLLFLLSFNCFAELSETERTKLRKLSLDFCSCRLGTHTIYFDKDKKLSKVFCRNNESKVFVVKDKPKKCEEN